MGLDYRVACCPDGLMTDRRHTVRVLDCSIRDGGCCNQWRFSEDFVRRTYRALVASGVEYMEIGYRSSPGTFDRERVGPWRFCDDDVLANIADFNSLIAQSHEHNTPVFALTDAQLDRVGFVLQTMRTNRNAFAGVFNQLAQSVIALTQI